MVKLRYRQYNLVYKEKPCLLAPLLIRDTSVTLQTDKQCNSERGGYDKGHFVLLDLTLF